MRSDRRVNCKHCLRDGAGLRVCSAGRSAMPTQAICRSCVYREPRRGSRGLGDWVELVLARLTGGLAKRAAAAIARKSGNTECGCSRRKAALNRIGAKPWR